MSGIIKSKELAQTQYAKIFMDILANCYDKITKEEAEAYAGIDNPEEVACSSEHISSLLNFIPSNYVEMTAEDQMKPTPHQIVLATAFQVT